MTIELSEYVIGAIADAVVKKMQEPCGDWYDVPSDEMTLGQARQAVKDLRKKLAECLEQEPKTGHWIDTGSGQMCSRCSEIQYGYDNFRRFCASCGAKMVEPQESEESE